MSTRDKAWPALQVVCSLALSIGMLALLPSTAAAQGLSGFADFCTAENPPSYDNANSQTSGMFTDRRNGDFINADNNLVLLPEPPDPDPFYSCALNFTGKAGAAGDMWITLLDEPGDSAHPEFPSPGADCIVARLWLKIHKFDNRKALGLVTNYDPETSMGLFWGVYDNGNSDALTLSTFDGSTGKLKGTVATLPLKSMIKEDVFYALVVLVCDAGTENAFALGHVTDDPEAEGATLFVDLSVLPAGIPPEGQIGIAGYAKNAFVDAAAYAFDWFPLF